MADTNGLVSFLNSLGQQADDSRTAKTLQNYAAATMYGGNGAAPQQPGVLSQILSNVTQPAAAAVSDSGLGSVPVAGQTLTSLLNSFGASRGADAPQQPAAQSQNYLPSSSPQSTAASPAQPGILSRLLGLGQQAAPQIFGQPQAPAQSQPGAVASAPPATAAPQQAASQPTTLNQNLAGILANRNQAYNLPPGYLAQTAMIESGGDPSAVSPTGPKGLFQFTGATAKQYGLTDPSNPIQSADAAGRLAADNAKALTQALGRPPTAGELYLAHQQGAAGAAALIKNPNAPAGQVLASIGADPNAIAVNGGDPNAPAGAFVGKWASRFDNNGSGQPTGMAYSGAQPQAPAQAEIQGATSGQPQVASADDGTDTPTTGRSASSPITAGVQTNMLSLGAPSPSKLPPQAALNALLANEGTRDLGIGIIKAYQAKQLGPTYTLTKIPGVGWINLNNDNGQGTLLKGDDVLSPEALEQKLQITKAGKEQNDSYSSSVIGEDAYGNKQYGILNKSTGTYTPVNPPAQSSGQPQQDVSNLHGADFLATLDPNIAGQVKAIAEGRTAYPTGMLLKSPIGQRLATYVTQYDPSFEAGNATTRVKLRNEFSTGGPSSPAAAITAGNTAIGHLGELSDAAEALNNGSIPTFNGWYNNAAQALGGGKTVTDFNNIVGRFAEEATKFYRGTGGTESDVQRDIANLNSAQSPAQLRTAIAAQARLMQSKIDALQDRWRNGMGPLVPDFPIVTQKSQQAMGRILGRNNPNGGQPSSTDLEAEARRRGLIR